MAKSKKSKRGASGTVKKHRTKMPKNTDSYKPYRFAMRMIGAKCAHDTRKYDGPAGILKAAISGEFGMLVRRAAFNVKPESALSLITYGMRFSKNRKMWE